MIVDLENPEIEIEQFNFCMQRNCINLNSTSHVNPIDSSVLLKLHLQMFKKNVFELLFVTFKSFY